MENTDIVRIIIDDISDRGEGIGKSENKAIFVPFLLPGDIADVKIIKKLKSRDLGKCIKIIKPSPYRIKADCSYEKFCGGCFLREMSYEGELLYKRKKVSDAFHRIGKFDIEVDEITGCENPDRYRNKIQMPFTKINGKIKCGFFKPKSHETIPIDDCLLQPEIFSKISEDVCQIMQEQKISVYDEKSNSGSLRHIFLRKGYHSNEIMLVIVSKNNIENKIKHSIRKLAEKYPDIKSIFLNINPKSTNVILGEKNILLFGNKTISDTMCGNIFRLSPFSFYQVNTLQAERLYRCAAKFADPQTNDTLLDFYCGAGTIGLSMAKLCKKIIGIEIVPQAIENAKVAAKENKIENAEFFCLDAEKGAKMLKSRGIIPDVITLDPPRKGCSKKTLEIIASFNAKKIVMVSCNPATAARDCRYLADLGYNVQRITPFDMFPRTLHVECVVLMSRKA